MTMLIPAKRAAFSTISFREAHASYYYYYAYVRGVGRLLHAGRSP